MLKTWMSNNFADCCSAKVPDILSNIIKLYMANNDSRCALISVHSDEAIDGLSLIAANVPDPITVSFFKASSENCSCGAFAPVENEFSLEANETATFIIQLTSSADAASVWHSFPARLIKDGKTLFDYNMDVKIFNVN